MPVCSKDFEDRDVAMRGKKNWHSFLCASASPVTCVVLGWISFDLS